MIKIVGRKPVKRVVAFILILSITCIYIIGNNFSFLPGSEESNLNTIDKISNSRMSNVDEDRTLRLAETNTKLGKISESLKDGYINLVASCANHDELRASVDEFSMLIANLKTQAVSELDETDNSSSEDDDYRSAVLSNFTKLEERVSKLSTDNTQAVLDEIKEMVDAERPYNTLAGELPFRNITNDDIAYEKYVATDVNNYEPEKTNLEQSNLEVTNDTLINDTMRSEFADLTSVLDVYQYIRNNYIPEFYYGSRKGAIGTFEEKSGNDYDMASLLIGVLRDRNIPARYIRSKIEITADQAMEWTATDNINVALRILSALGIPTTGLTSDGEIVAVRLEHVWVEAYVPYTDYRGAGNGSGDSLWIPLDVSFKELYLNDGLDLASMTDYRNDENNFLTSASEIYGVNVGNISTVIDSQNSALVKYIIENGYGESTKVEVFGGKDIVRNDLGYLPLTLPYSVVEKIDSFDDIPLNLTDKITFSLVGNSAFDLNFNGSVSINKTLYTPDIYGKRISLSYVPATDADKNVLAKYGDIFNTPAYLLKLKPQLIIDGDVVAKVPFVMPDICNNIPLIYIMLLHIKMIVLSEIQL